MGIGEWEIKKDLRPPSARCLLMNPRAPEPRSVLILRVKDLATKKKPARGRASVLPSRFMGFECPIALPISFAPPMPCAEYCERCRSVRGHRAGSCRHDRPAAS